MWSDRISNPGPLALELDALPFALCSPFVLRCSYIYEYVCMRNIFINYSREMKCIR